MRPVYRGWPAGQGGPAESVAWTEMPGVRAPAGRAPQRASRARFGRSLSSLVPVLDAIRGDVRDDGIEVAPRGSGPRHPSLNHRAPSQPRDPPYLTHTRTSGRRNRYDYTQQEHRDLLVLVKRLPCAVILSGYPSTLYAASLSDWQTRALQVMNQAGVRTEHLWFNFTPVRRQWPGPQVPGPLRPASPAPRAGEEDGLRSDLGDSQARAPVSRPDAPRAI